MSDEQPNPRPITPSNDSSLGANPHPELSFAEQMASIVDDARQLQTDLGLRPYRVFSVLVRWSGGEIGRGNASTLSEQEILPTPKLDYRSLKDKTLSGGRVERGMVRLTEVSARFTEDDLNGLFHVKPLSKGTESFVEIVHDARDGKTERRRFGVSDVPWRDAENFQWVVPLSREDQSRKRDGSVAGARVHHERRSI